MLTHLWGFQENAADEIVSELITMIYNGTISDDESQEEEEDELRAMTVKIAAGMWVKE